MDRLLCGDVGFGKTEVALRAAFKCVMGGKQCAILAPTTISATPERRSRRVSFCCLAVRKRESSPIFTGNASMRLTSVL